jgi:hypothetical protein
MDKRIFGLENEYGVTCTFRGSRRLSPDEVARYLFRRDFTVDWVHLKLNDQAQRTVLCKDPFRAVDERVEKLIAGM